jgi:hypothetical protein
VGDEYDALVVHVDAAMADKVDAERPCPPPRATTDELRRVISQDWLRRHPLPRFVVVTTPSKTTDTWAVAALGIRTLNLECDKGAEALLVAGKRLRRRFGQVKKPRRAYEALAHKVADQWTQVRKVCTEARRFEDGVRSLRPLQAP